jgi:hypothetical protein
MEPKLENPQAAQNQHFVPKFILRNFLENPEKEAVHVFSKSKNKVFSTSIKNIMAERRFHEFRIDSNYIANFEQTVCRVEDMLLPTYKALVERRKFDGSPEEKAHLAIFVAFQYLRTRSQRDMFASLTGQVAKWLEKSGHSIEQLDGYEPLTDDIVARQHMRHMQEGIGKITDILSTKDFLLASAPLGRSFYLSDCPVCIHNETQNTGPYSNMGLASLGIQIYLPLSADLLLCLWCPSLREKMEIRCDKQKRDLSSLILSPLFVSVKDGALFQRQIEQMRSQRLDIEERLQYFNDGKPIPYSIDNIDFNNSLQVSQAKEHLICKNSDFELARRHVKDFGSGQALSLTVS